MSAQEEIKVNEVVVVAEKDEVKTETETKADVKTEVKSEVKSETKTETKTEVKPEVKAEVKADKLKTVRCSYFDGPDGCSKGDACTFSHDPLSEKKPSKKKEKKLRCSYFDSPEGCTKGDACTFSHDPLAEKKRCSYIDGPNGCWKGDDCEFSHKPLEKSSDKPSEKPTIKLLEKPKEKEQPKTIYAKPGVLPIRKAPHLVERDKQVALAKAKEQAKAKAVEKKRCGYIDGPNGCWKGDDCEFDHSPLKSTAADAPPIPPPAPIPAPPLIIPMSPAPTPASAPRVVKAVTNLSSVFCLEDWLSAIHPCVLELAPILRLNNIDSLKTLSFLTKEDCKELGMNVGQRNLILDAIQTDRDRK